MSNGLSTEMNPLPLASNKGAVYNCIQTSARTELFGLAKNSLATRHPFKCRLFRLERRIGGVIKLMRYCRGGVSFRRHSHHFCAYYGEWRYHIRG